MGWRNQRRVMRHYRGDSARKLALLALAYYLNDETLTAWPSVATIADDLGLSLSQTKAHLSGLADEGVIVREERPGTSHLYSLALACPDDCDGTDEHGATSKRPTRHGERPPKNPTPGSWGGRSTDPLGGRSTGREGAGLLGEEPEVNRKVEPEVGIEGARSCAVPSRAVDLVLDAHDEGYDQDDPAMVRTIPPRFIIEDDDYSTEAAAERMIVAAADALTDFGVIDGLAYLCTPQALALTPQQFMVRVNTALFDPGRFTRSAS